MRTLSEPFSFEEEIKKSRFIAHAMPVSSSEEALGFFSRLHEPEATHNCWAFKVGQNYRFNDDGEPSGTAGRPILATIEGNELSNVLVLVNRWYGGIKLGTGGLVRAYGGCAGQCLLLADKIELIIKIKVSFHCQFNEWAILQYELNQQQVEFEEHYTDTGVEVKASLQTPQIAIWSLKIQDISRGREQLRILQEPEDD